jgi:hypothetical protein
VPKPARTRLALAAPAAELPRAPLPAPLAELLDHHAALAGRAAMPARAAFDPIRLPRLLANLMLWDVPAAADGDYRCRLAGTEICRVAGRELRGETLEQVNGADTPQVRAEFDAVRARGVASYVERSMNWADRPYRFYRRLLLPFSDDGSRVDLLMGAVLFETAAP